MLIRINCPNPNCKKQLRVDAKHAGKKISCAGCNQHIRLPTAEELKINVKAAVAAPAKGAEEEIIDFDMLAAQAVHAEKAAEVEAIKTEMIEFTCPQCDEVVKISAENAGKRAPCPSCRRIITIPKQDAGKPKDWREKEATGPSLAKKEEVKLEGAWGNQETTRVSIEAMEEAKALPKIKRKLTVRDYVRYVTYAVLLIAVLGISWWGWKRYRASSLEGNTLTAIQSAIADTKLPADLNAVLRLGLGEWKLRTSAGDDVRKDGLAELRSVINNSSGDPLWKWVLANDVANITGAMVTLDLAQPGVVNLDFLVQLITNVPPGEPREDVVRTLCRSVLHGVKPDKIETARTFLTAVIKQAIQPGTMAESKDKPGGAMRDYSEQLSALGILAQELIRLEHKDSALQLLGKSSDRGERAIYKKGMPVPKPLVAAMAALAQQDLEVNKDFEGEIELGKMMGYFRSNQDARGTEILRKMQTSLDPANLTSYLDIAEQAIDASRMSEAQSRLTDAMKIAELYTQRRSDAWKLRVYAHVKLCELTARTGAIALAEERINKLKLDELPVAALVARTLVARQRPVQASDGDSLLAGLPANSSGQALAAYSLAMKQGELVSQPDPKITIAAPEGPVRSLALLGGLLGFKITQVKK
jgi:hypothetical protein